MANQIIIDIGAAANDGTGDPLRTAFNYVNENFSNVWNTGLPTSNVQFLDNRILTVNTNANLVLAPNGIGKVVSNVDVLPNSANVLGLGSPTRRWNSIYTQFLNVSGNTSFNNLTVTGNLTAGNIHYTSNVFVGDLEGSVFDGASSVVLDVIDSTIYVDNYRYANGAPLNVGTSYANANAVAYGEAGWGGNIVPTGNSVYSLGNATHQWNDLYLSNSTIYMNGVPVGMTGNVLTVSGANVVTTTPTGNISANYFLGNGSQLTGIVTSTGNLSIVDQTINGTAINADIVIAPEGSGTVVVPGIEIPSGVLTAENGDFNIDSVDNVDIRMSAGTGTIVTGSNIVPSTHDEYTLGNDNFHYNSIFLGTGGIDIQNNVGNVNVTLKAMAGNLVVGNASGLTVADFTFYNNAITIGNLQQDISIGTVGATGNVVFNRSIQVKDSANTRNVFSASSNGFVQILANNIPSQTAGALNIVGSDDGSYQTVNGAGGMLHITGNPDTSARITVDGWTTSGTNPQPATAIGAGLITLRAGRGTPTSPLPMKSGDHLGTIAALGYTGSGQYSQGQTGLLFYAAEDFTANTAIGTYANLQVTPVGSNVAVTAVKFQGNGIVLPTAGSGITFPDATVQTTAFDPTDVVQSLTVGTGLSQIGTQGNVSINATGVQNVVGTTNQVIVSDSGGKNLTLSLPQSINTNSTVQFANLTVTNLVVTGNSSAANSLSLNDKTFVLANNSTSASQIDGGGMILGNVLDGSYYRTFLYDLNNDRWDTDGAGLATLELTAGNVYMETLWANNSGHFGGAYTGNTYPDAVIQADSDVNSYSQIVNQNHSIGTDASADFVAVNDIGTDTNNFIDMGVNSSTYSNPAYSITVANDGYMFTNGGNLAIGTQTATKNIVFHTGNTTSDALRATITDTGLSVVGNINAGNLVTTGNLVGTNLVLSGNITAPYTSAVLTTGNQPNITTVGILTSLSVTGNVNSGNLRTAGQVSATGNVTGANFLTGGIVSTTGNISGGNLSITAISATSVSAVGNITGGNLVSGAGTFSAQISATGNITGGNVNTGGVVSATGNIRGANFNTAGLVAATGNIDGGNLRTGGIVVATGNLQTAGQLVSTLATGTPPLVISSTTKVSGLNVEQVDGFDASQANTASTIVVRDSAANIAAANFNGAGASVTGNINAAFFLGNGSALTGITATSALTAVTVTGNAQANITSVGTLTSLSVSGNITAGNVSGTLLTGTLTTAAQPNVTSVGTLSSLTVTGNVSGGNLLTAGLASVSGNITGGNLNTAGNLTATYGVFGNITIGNNSVFSSSGSTDINIGLISSTANVNINRNTNFANNTVTTGNATAGNLTTAGTVVTKNLVYDAGPFDNGSITTTLALDFNNGSLQFVTLGAANPTFTLSNAQAGKVIILIIRNTSGSNRTVTHGVAAGNTTTGSATNTVNNGRIGMYQYICKDDTVANVQLGFM